MIAECPALGVLANILLKLHTLCYSLFNKEAAVDQNDR